MKIAYTFMNGQRNAKNFFKALLDFQDFRKFVQTQRKNMTAALYEGFRRSKFFSTTGVGDIDKHLNIEEERRRKKT